jgi:hypothetical protein
MSNQKELLKLELVDACKHFLPEYLINQPKFEPTIDRFADELIATPIQDSPYYDEPNWYAGIMDINNKNVYEYGDFFDLVHQTLNLGEYEMDCTHRSFIKQLPTYLDKNDIKYHVHPKSTWSDALDELAAKLKGEFIIHCPVENGELVIDEKELDFDNENIMPNHQWAKIREYNHFYDAVDSLLPETNNQYMVTGGNIIAAIQDCLIDEFEPIILKDGYMTRLKARNPNYSYDDLLSERSAIDEIVIAVYDFFLIAMEKESNDFRLWYVNRNEAEPWSHYTTYEKLMNDLPNAYKAYGGLVQAA